MINDRVLQLQTKGIVGCTRGVSVGPNRNVPQDDVVAGPFRARACNRDTRARGCLSRNGDIGFAVTQSVVGRLAIKINRAADIEDDGAATSGSCVDPSEPGTVPPLSESRVVT
jgi:hypothetical protein